MHIFFFQYDVDLNIYKVLSQSHCPSANKQLERKKAKASRKGNVYKRYTSGLEAYYMVMRSLNTHILSVECKVVVESNAFQNHLAEGNIERSNFYALRHDFATRCTSIIYNKFKE